MNPIFSWIIAHTVGGPKKKTGTPKSSVRRCPKCQNEQLVQKEQADLTVSCQRCGGSIPPG